MPVAAKPSPATRGFCGCNGASGTQLVAHTHLPSKIETISILTTDDIVDSVMRDLVNDRVMAAYQSALISEDFDTTATDWTIIVHEGTPVSICSYQKGEQFAFPTPVQIRNMHGGYCSLLAFPVVTRDTQNNFEKTLKKFPCLRVLSRRAADIYSSDGY